MAMLNNQRVYVACSEWIPWHPPAHRSIMRNIAEQLKHLELRDVRLLHQRNSQVRQQGPTIKRRPPEMREMMKLQVMIDL